MPTTLVVGGGEVFKGLATMALVWLASWLAYGATLLARAWVEAMYTIRIFPPRARACAMVTHVVGLR
jgi:hypothetical protein